MELLLALNLSEVVQNQLVKGENVAQALHFVSSGNVELGIVASSLAKIAMARTKISCVDLNHSAAPAIPQDAILLQRGMDNLATRALLGFLQTPDARQLIQQAGYTIDAD